MPTTPTLTFADQQDGTGATATVSGSSVGSTNEVFYLAWSGSLLAGSFSSGGSRVGDGTVDVAVGTGLYWGYVISTLSGSSAISSMVGFQVTSGDESVYYQILVAARDTIQALSLSGVNSSSVVIRKFPWDERTIYQGISISPRDPAEAPTYHDRPSNVRELIGYPIIVTIVEGTGRDSTRQISSITDRRQRIFRTFHNKTLAGVVGTNTNQVICKVQMQEVNMPKQFVEQYDATQMLIWAWVLEPRSN